MSCSRKNLIRIPLLKWKPPNVSSVLVLLLKIQFHRRDPQHWPNLANMLTSRKGMDFWFWFHVCVQWVKGKPSEGDQNTLGKRSLSWGEENNRSTTLQITNDAAFPTIFEYYILWHMWWCTTKSNGRGSSIVISYSSWILSSKISWYRPWICKWLIHFILCSYFWTALYP